MRAWDPSQISSRFQVRLLTAADVPDVLRLCQGNPLFYQYCPPFVSESGILEDMEKLPPRTVPEDKYYLGYFEKGQLVGVMDLIRGYPEPGAAFIGFFMTEAARQGQGLGSQIIEDLCTFLTRQRCPFIRLGWVEGNPQSEHFWHKNGFRETGVVSRQETYTIICAQRNLTQA